jgi:MFS-type transporter involved in bile tolerance (Atg22 family)
MIKVVAVALWDPSSNSYLSNSVPEAERGKFFGCLAGLRGLVSFPAPIIGAFIFEAHGFRGAVLASLLCSLMAVVLSFKNQTAK